MHKFDEQNQDIGNFLRRNHPLTPISTSSLEDKIIANIQPLSNPNYTNLSVYRWLMLPIVTVVFFGFLISLRLSPKYSATMELEKFMEASWHYSLDDDGENDLLIKRNYLETENHVNSI